MRVIENTDARIAANGRNNPTDMEVSKVNSLSHLCVLLLLFSCGTKRDSAHDHQHPDGGEETEWKQMDDFHQIMAEIFHPYKDSANLEPAKSRASELMVAADKWASAPLPKKVDTRAIKAKLQQLSEEAASLAESVRSADDNVIAEQLTRVHDTFHEIQEEWYRSR